MPVLTLGIARQGQAATEEGDVPEVGEHHAHPCTIWHMLHTHEIDSRQAEQYVL